MRQLPQNEGAEMNVLESVYYDLFGQFRNYKTLCRSG